VADARLLRLALTASHPASVEADSQYPVAEAMRLAKLLLDGLEACTRASRRLYVVGTTEAVDEVPPGALLREAPPKLGAGYDLGAAPWLVRDHAFVRLSSIDAFVAARRLARDRTAVLDYLGVGDPVPSKDMRATAPPSAALASLPELPQTTEELERVASLFPRDKVRLLTRGAATEEAFRLQPLSEFDTLHFATHGLVREELPGLSEPALVFTSPPGGDALKGDDLSDGLLGTSQIAALPLRARLVILSACNSARYAPSIIDSGIQGLSLAFAIAGVPTTLAALWPVESSVARDVVVATFGFAREQRLAIADALAAAQRRHLDGPAPRPFKHPRFWAALVLLGDGALAFDARGPAVPRLLGPFAPAGAEAGAILSVAALENDFVSAEIGPYDGRRSASLVRRRAADGTVRWQVGDAAISAGPVVGSGGVFAAGYEMAGDGGEARVLPVVRAIDTEGRPQWSLRLPASRAGTTVIGLAPRPYGTALALFGPPAGDASGARLVSVPTDPAPSPVIDLDGDARGALSAWLGIANDAALVAINRSPELLHEPARSFDWLGWPNHCFGGDHTDLRFFALTDRLGLQEQRRVRIDRLRVEAAFALDDGWLLVGDERAGCGVERSAAVWRLGADGTMRRLWRDGAPFDTFGRGVRWLEGGFEVVGYARRAIAADEVRRSAALNGLLASRRQGDEAYVSGEAFAVRLSPSGSEERRDFVGAGLPVVPMGLAASGERAVVFGAVGGRPLWLQK
jgi:hypothetical protein